MNKRSSFSRTHAAKASRYRPRAWLVRASLILAAATAPAAAEPQLETVLPPQPVKGNANVFATPLAYRDGAVYTANVEPNPDGGRTGLRTVVRRGMRDQHGAWRWQANVIETDTVLDPYHTEASIALDRLGYVHVAYGMHNAPWQYSVSTQPEAIDSFDFRGKPVSLEQRQSSKNGNVVFPGRGDAAIPGNQITYPAFFNDRRGQLYVTYRYAVRPKASWYQRIFAGAIARYDADTGRWQQLGGNVNLRRTDVALPEGINAAVTRPFAMEPGWWVYQIRLAFDTNNGLHASWLWRRGNAGGDGTEPSYAYSPPGSDDFYRSNGDAYLMPIRLKQAERIITDSPARQLAPHGFYNPARIAVTPYGNPLVSIQAIGGQRYAFRRSVDRNWLAPDRLPYNAWQVRYDEHGNEWAFASGLTVLQRPVDKDGSPTAAWRPVFRGGDLCNPRVVRATSDDVYFIHGNVLSEGRCRDDQVTIVQVSGLLQ